MEIETTQPKSQKFNLFGDYTSIGLIGLVVTFGIFGFSIGRSRKLVSRPHYNIRSNSKWLGYNSIQFLISHCRRRSNSTVNFNPIRVEPARDYVGEIQKTTSSKFPYSKLLIDYLKSEVRGKKVETEVAGNVVSSIGGVKFESKMSFEEAAKIIGIPNGDAWNPKLVTSAHRRVILRNHPDRGGAPFLATKINEAKEKLLAMDEGTKKRFKDMMSSTEETGKKGEKDEKKDEKDKQATSDKDNEEKTEEKKENQGTEAEDVVQPRETKKKTKKKGGGGAFSGIKDGALSFCSKFWIEL